MGDGSKKVTCTKDMKTRDNSPDLMNPNMRDVELISKKDNVRVWKYYWEFDEQEEITKFHGIYDEKDNQVIPVKRTNYYYYGYNYIFYTDERYFYDYKPVTAAMEMKYKVKNLCLNYPKNM